MKRNSILAVMLGGLFLAAGAGTVFSGGGEMPAGGMSDSESMSAPDTGSIQPEPPVETGTLPTAEDLYKTPDSSIGEVLAEENPGNPASEEMESK